MIKKHRFIVGSSIIAAMMFAFTYAMVPVYEKVCQRLGYNGRLMKKPEEYIPGSIAVDKTRTIKVRFLGDVKADVPWKFFPEQPEVFVHPGELAEAKFIAMNYSDKPVSTRVVVNTIPLRAVKNMHEVVTCFCTRTHTLAPLEQVQLPVGFYIDKNLPKGINELIVSYTLFNAGRYTTPRPASMLMEHHAHQHHEI